MSDLYHILMNAYVQSDPIVKYCPSARCLWLPPRRFSDTTMESTTPSISPTEMPPPRSLSPYIAFKSAYLGPSLSRSLSHVHHDIRNVEPAQS